MAAKGATFSSVMRVSGPLRLMPPGILLDELDILSVNVPAQRQRLPARALLQTNSRAEWGDGGVWRAYLGSPLQRDLHVFPSKLLKNS
jgi:hypothetical protein